VIVEGQEGQEGREGRDGVLTRSQQRGLLILLIAFIVYVLLRVR
jgi:hypothetical protein